jgi:hypothetical protein
LPVLGEWRDHATAHTGARSDSSIVVMPSLGITTWHVIMSLTVVEATRSHEVSVAQLSTRSQCAAPAAATAVPGAADDDDDDDDESGPEVVVAPAAAKVVADDDDDDVETDSDDGAARGIAVTLSGPGASMAPARLRGPSLSHSSGSCRSTTTVNAACTRAG